MKKLIIFLVALFLGINIVDASNYVDLTQYDFSKGTTLTKEIELNGHQPRIKKRVELRDHGIAMIGYYQETNSEFKDSGYLIPGSAGGQTNVRTHAKLVKIDSEYNKLWETNIYEIGNWVNASVTADTVKTDFLDIAELSDGSIVAVGLTGGLINPNSNPLKPEDFDNAFFARVDANGNEVYRKSFIYEGLKEAIAVRALTNGGYIIKYAGYEVTLTSGEVSNEKAYYAAYDSNNTLLELFPASEYYKLGNYDYIENDAVPYLINKTSVRIDGTTIYRKMFLGINIDGTVVFFEDQNYIKSYDANTMELKNTINLVESVPNIAISSFNIFMTNEGAIYFDDVLYSKSGEVLMNYKGAKVKPTAGALVLSNGNIFSGGNFGKISVIEPTEGNDDVANFIIDGKKITSRLGTFIENDRTYININNLCGILACSFRMSEKKDNMLIIDFPFVKNAKYTVTYELGSKKYTSYLSVQPHKIFRLKSPTFDESSVDVTSKEINGQIYVPLRFISEAAGRYVTFEPAKDGGKPTITISGQNKGEFYDKYSVEVSYDKLQNGDTLNNIVNDSELALEWGLQKLLYGYGYDKTTKQVLSVEDTVFVPLLLSGKNSEYIPYEDKSDSSLKNHYFWDVYESQDNWIGKSELYKDDNGKEGDKYVGDGDIHKFLVVSNIDGYPFAKVLTFKDE